MENWTCSKCRALNPPRRNQCWQCGIPRRHHIPSIIERTQQTSTVKRIVPRKQKPRSKKASPTVTVAIIGLVGTLITALAASPVLIAFIQRTPIPSSSPNSSPTITAPATSILPTETPQLTSSDLKIEYGGPFIGAYSPLGGFMRILTARPTHVLEWSDIEGTDGLTLPEGNIVTFSVTNQSSQTVILNNKIPLEVNHTPATNILHVFLIQNEGGEANYRNFITKIPAELGQQVIWAEFEEGGFTADRSPINQPDFFTLVPGETEVFQIEVQFADAGDYTLRPGVEFNENGTTGRVWAPDVISASFPETLIVWSQDLTTQELVNNGTCHFNRAVSLSEVSGGLDDFFKAVYNCDF